MGFPACVPEAGFNFKARGESQTLSLSGTVGGFPSWWLWAMVIVTRARNAHTSAHYQARPRIYALTSSKEKYPVRCVMEMFGGSRVLQLSVCFFVLVGVVGVVLPVAVELVSFLFALFSWLALLCLALLGFALLCLLCCARFACLLWCLLCSALFCFALLALLCFALLA